MRWMTCTTANADVGPGACGVSHEGAEAGGFGREGHTPALLVLTQFPSLSVFCRFISG